MGKPDFPTSFLLFRPHRPSALLLVVKLQLGFFDSETYDARLSTFCDREGGAAPAQFAGF